MLEVQKQLKPVLKDNYNNFTQSRYATLNSVMEACSEALLMLVFGLRNIRCRLKVMVNCLDLSPSWLMRNPVNDRSHC